MVDHKIGYCIGLAQADIYCNATASILFQPQSAPTHNASAVRAKVYFQGGIGFPRPFVRAGFAFNPNAFILIIIGPKRAVATAKGAVAGGDGPRIAAQGPACFAAMARTFKRAILHPSSAVSSANSVSRTAMSSRIGSRHFPFSQSHALHSCRANARRHRPCRGWP